MLFFDYERIFILARGNSNVIINLVRKLIEDPKLMVLISGSSFILNPDVIYYNTYKLSNRQLAEYLGLLALRNFAEYKISKDTSLDIQYVPIWIPRKVIDTNPLIEISKDKLKFIEEK